MKIEIKKDPRYPIDVKKVRQMAKEILKDNNVSEEVELSLNFVGKRKAKKLNQQYRNKDYIPGVLSFPMHEEGPDGTLQLGDVMVCFPEARAEARKRERLVIEIIREWLEHGIDNLVNKS
jgi:probable rRNA maturation factor